MVFVVSQSEAVVEMVKAGLRTSEVVHATDSDAYLKAVVKTLQSEEACVIVDLATVSDAERLIAFTRSSSSIGRLPIIVIGSDERMDALPQELQSSINGFVSAPCTAGELAAVVASICEQDPAPGRGISPAG